MYGNVLSQGKSLISNEANEIGAIDPMLNASDGEIKAADLGKSTEFTVYKPEGNTIPIEFVNQLFEELEKINELELCDIVWTEKGVPINIHPKDLEDFKFTGLSNSYFARLKFWGKSL